MDPTTNDGLAVVFFAFIMVLCIMLLISGHYSSKRSKARIDALFAEWEAEARREAAKTKAREQEGEDGE